VDSSLLLRSVDAADVDGRCAVVGADDDAGVDDEGDDSPSMVAAANAAVVCDKFLFFCFPAWLLKGENRLWKGEERGERGDLDSTGDAPGETVSAVSGLSLLRIAASGSDWAWA
jgi:hypothetical protein